MIWGSLLVEGLVAVATSYLAWWTHSTWRRRLAGGRWQRRRWVAAVALAVYVVSTLALVGSLQATVWCALAFMNAPANALDIRSQLLDHWVPINGNIMQVTFISTTISGVVLFGVVALPIAGRTESPEDQKKIRHKSHIVY